MTNLLEELAWRGFIQDQTDEEGLKALFAASQVTAYAGFDATADSLHVGHMIPIMGLAHLQRAGHRPIAVVGGATTMIGDPSGKTEMRKMLTEEEIGANLLALKEQLSRFIDFSSGKALLENNADWMREYRYIDFLRDVGRHFSVNRMLTQDSVKLRMETGISFIEFNYMILQAYDFATLYKKHGCRLQFGGSDQWGNIIMGVDLARRLHNGQVFGMTFPLIMTSSGKKMGKTEAGAVWLDAKRTSPYEFYQYWINCEDADVGRFLRMYTFLPRHRIEELSALQGADLRVAKKELAFAVTEIVHGKAEADKAVSATQAAFGGGGQTDELPTSTFSRARLGQITMVDLLLECGLAASKGEGRRLIQQGGVSVNEVRLSTGDNLITNSDFPAGVMMVRLGKKRYFRVKLEEN